MHQVVLNVDCFTPQLIILTVTVVYATIIDFFFFFWTIWDELNIVKVYS